MTLLEAQRDIRRAFPPDCCAPWDSTVPEATHTQSRSALSALAAALVFSVILTYAKFGQLSGMPLGYSINRDQGNFALKYGIFRVARVPYSFADYFFLRYPELQNEFPFLSRRKNFEIP